MRWITCIAYFLSFPLVVGNSGTAFSACSNPAGVEAEIIYNSVNNTRVMQYCDDVNWIAMVGSAECQNIGEICSDGSVYAGLSPDGNVPMYTTPDDAGLFAWNDANSTGYTTTSVTNDVTGQSNTSALIGLDSNSDAGGTQPHRAAQHCYDLVAHGRSDWYLPARNELAVLRTNRDAIGGFNLSGEYWSSSESLNTSAKYNRFSDGLQSAQSKYFAIFARCVRKQSSTLTQIVPSGLVGHWRLDETSGTAAADSSGNGNNGSVLGSITWVNEGRVGTSVRLSPGFSAITVPQHSSINSLDQISISAWVKGVTGGGGRVVSKAGEFNLTGDTGGQTVGFSANRWSIQGGFWRLPNNSFSGSDGDWTHIAVTYDYSSTANDAQWYVNGRLITSGITEIGSPSGTPQASTNDLYIGNHSGMSNSWSNNLDDIRIYNRVLTAAEILEIYNARDGFRYNATSRVPEFFDGNRMVAMTRSFPDVTSGLIGHWKLDETTGTTAVDSSGSGYTLSYDGNGPCSNAGSTATGAVGRSLYINSNTCILYRSGLSAVELHNATSFSVGGWFKIDSATGPNLPILYRTHDTLGSAVSWGILLNFGGSAGRVDFDVKNTADAGFGASWNGPYQLGRWYHFMGVKNGTSLQLFVDGVAVSSGTFSGTEANSVGDLFMTDGYSERADYWADDLRYYSRALTPAEIQALYNMGAPVGATTALPQGCPSIGDVCDDGTVYAGLSPDGNVAMFTTPMDAGRFFWNNGNGSGFISTSQFNYATGSANTRALSTLDSNSGVAGFQPHQAADYCYRLAAHGADDWYLPAVDELTVMRNNHNAIGGFNLSASYPANEYWTSNECFLEYSVTIRFNDGAGDCRHKPTDASVRCVRKGPAPRCANPYGLEGAMFYNTNYDVMQYCDGARWIAIGKIN